MKTLVAVMVGLMAAGVTGTWNMDVDSPHGKAKMTLVLTQDGDKVTGTFASGHGDDQTVTGEVKDGTLKLATTSDDDHKVTFTAKLKDDALQGYASTPMGDMKWTASRAKDK